MTDRRTILTRSYAATPETIWRLWTTADGIGQWWAPDGFTTAVQTLDLQPDGALVYTMTATGPAQIEFMTNAGMPLETESRKTFVDIDAPHHLSYRSTIDFVPDHEPYEHLTLVDLAATDDGTEVTMTIEPMHDAEWTQRLVAGRTNELDNLARVLDGTLSS